MTVPTDREFKNLVCYFWTEKNDPTRCVDWDAARCAALMPEFYEAWSKYVIYEKLTTFAAMAAENYGADE